LFSCGSPASKPAEKAGVHSAEVVSAQPEAATPNKDAGKQGQQALAEKPAPRANKAPAVNLRYGWKPGDTYVYAVHVAYDLGKSLVTFDGSSIYHAKESEKNGTNLAHRGWLVIRQRPSDLKSGTPTTVRMPSAPASITLLLDPKGDVQDAQGALAVPLLGDLSMLVIEPLADDAVAEWNDVQELTLNEVQRSGGASLPLSMARPNAVSRSRESRLSERIRQRSAGGLASRQRGGAGAAAGSRLGGRPAGGKMARNTAARPATNSSSNVTIVAHPVGERSAYSLGTRSGDTVLIKKTYELKTEEVTGDKPHLLMTGQGTTTFDIKAGVPLAVEFKATVTENLTNGSVIIPIEVTCKLLAGKERARALVFPIIPETAMLPLSAADLREAQADLKSPDTGRRVRAAERLRDSAPTGNRAAVAQELVSLLDDRDAAVRNAAIKALGVWGDKSIAAILIKRLNDDRYGNRGELFEALGRIEPDERTAIAMTEWFKKDEGQASRVLRSMGAAAEPAVLEFLKTGSETRPLEAACRVLRDIGTGQSVPVLKLLAGTKDNIELGQMAERAARAIAGRLLTDADVTSILKDIDSPDLGRRRAAVHRLREATPIESHRSAVATALSKHLSDPDGGIQTDVTQTLKTWGDPAAATALATALKSHSFRPWRDGIEALARLSHTKESAEAIAGWTKEDRGLVMRSLEEIGPSAEPALVALLEPQNEWPIRADACKALGAIGSTACIPSLKRSALDKKDGLVAMAAENALKDIEARTLTDAQWHAIRDDLQSVDANRRREAAVRLAKAQPEPKRRAIVAEALISCLDQSDEPTQKEIVRALGKWGNDESARVLIERCNNPSYKPWRETLEALARFDPGARTADAIVARLADDGGYCYQLLRGMGAPAEPALIRAFQNAPDARVRFEAAKALETIGTDMSLDLLRKAAPEPGEAELAHAAEDALKGIAERP
jgi:HEAT repeat protein